MLLTKTLETIPDSALKDITAKPQEQSSPAPAASGSATEAAKATNALPHQQSQVSAADALKGTEHTKISSLFDSANPQTGATGATVTPLGGSLNIGQLLDGKMAVELWDAMLPGLMVALLYKAGLEIRKTELQLTQKEKDFLAPLVQKCLDTLAINVTNPWAALALSVGIIYGSKIGEKGFVAWIDKKNVETAKKAAMDAAREAGGSLNQEQAQAQVLDKLQAASGITEDEIRATMKSKKWNRERTILFLDRQRKKGLK